MINSPISNSIVSNQPRENFVFLESLFRDFTFVGRERFFIGIYEL